MTRPTNEPEMPFARHQRNSQRNTLVVVISGDGEMLTSAPSSVAGEMGLVCTAFYVMFWKWMQKSIENNGSMLYAMVTIHSGILNVLYYIKKNTCGLHNPQPSAWQVNAILKWGML